MRNKNIKIIAIILCCLFTFNYVAKPRQAYAFGLEGAIVGGVGAVGTTIALPEIIVAVALIFGVSLTTAWVSSHIDDIQDVFDNACKKAGATTKQVSEWIDNAKKGYIDTKNKIIWSAFVSAVQYAISQAKAESGPPLVSSQCMQMQAGDTYEQKRNVANYPKAQIFNITNTQPIYVVSLYTSETSAYYFAVSKEPFSYDFYSIDKKTGEYQYNKDGTLKISTRKMNTSSTYKWNDVTFKAYVMGFTTQPIEDEFVYNDSLITQSDWNTNMDKFLYELLGISGVVSDTYATVYNPVGDIADDVSVNVPTGAINIPDILDGVGADSIADLQDKLLDGTITLPQILDVADAEIIQDDVVLDITADEQPPEKTDKEPEQPNQKEQYVDDMRVYGLTKVFPFCIPFDLYNICESFKAEPEAPRIEWNFKTYSGKDNKLVIDLAPFNDIAELLRNLEIILFVVGLALITRELIRS